MRDDALKRITDIRPSYNVTSVKDNFSADIFRWEINTDNDNPSAEMLLQFELLFSL